jgi:hypothetical protein
MTWKGLKTKGSSLDRDIIPVYVAKREEIHGGRCPGIDSNRASSDNESAFPSRQQKKKDTPWPVVRKRIIPAERPPLVGKVSVNFSG